MYRIAGEGKTEWNEIGQPKLREIKHVSKLRMLREILAQEIEYQSLPAAAREVETSQELEN